MNSGLDFEALVADAYRRLGYTTRLTPRTGDQGVDVIAERGSEVMLIQCKHIAQDASVGIAEVQRLAGVQRQFRATTAALVTTGRFSREAQGAAARLGVILVGPADLLNKLVEVWRAENSPPPESAERPASEPHTCLVCRARFGGVNHNGRCARCNS